MKILRNPNAIKSILIFLSILTVKANSEPVHVDVAEITDTRSTGQFYGGCEIELNVTGDEVATSFGIKDVKISIASDNLGRDLIREDESNDLFFSPNKEGSNTLSKKIKLKNPSRSATLISTLEGTVELFQPTVDNGGEVIVEDYMNKPGILIRENLLSKYDIELMYLTKDIYEQKKAIYQNARKNEIDKIGEMVGDPFVELFKGYFGSSLMDEQNSLKFYVTDNQNHLVDLQFLDKNDKLIETWGRSSMGKLRTYSFKESLPTEDSKLVIYIATDSSVKNVNFKIDDIALP